MAEEDFHVFRYWFHDADHVQWEPDDSHDFEFWMYVTVGDGTAGTDYQVHICTPISIRRVRDKFGVFMVEEWEGIDPLIESMNQFIEQLARDVAQPVDHALSRHWIWEYGYVPKRPKP